VLCERFRCRFGRLAPDGTPSEFLLNEVARELEVPRRRLYDIVNVMEACEVRCEGAGGPQIHGRGWPHVDVCLS
jgi:E2F/DP family winged-helix DNA-binding domain